MKELLSHIFEWSWYSEEKGYNFNGHVVIGRDASIIIDPPPLNESDLAWLEEHRPYAAALLTNRDHTREADSLRKRLGIPIYAPEADAPLMEIKIDRTFRDQDSLPGGLKAIHIPDNKSPGETAFLLDRENGILMIGDAVIGKPAGRLSLMPADKYKDIRQAREGLKVLLRYSFDAILTGDGASILTGGRGVLEGFLQESHA